MWSHTAGCGIQRIGTPGSYLYDVAPDWANRPVNHVSWGDAARFANWLHNGQPSGAQELSTTEDGSYLLNGATTDATLGAVTRGPNATWAIPTEDEWYKAAYHRNDGVTGNYWSFPTGTDDGPANQLVSPDPGNNATFWQEGYGFTIGSPYYRTEVGAHQNSDSPYGTFDQGGNVWEWNEAIIERTGMPMGRGLRGGSYAQDGHWLLMAFQPDFPPTHETDFGFIFGFRVIEVPEPGTLLLLAAGSCGVLRRPRNPPQPKGSVPLRPGRVAQIERPRRLDHKG
jgi:formylglycine-generating enzyme required for sulfatase activity